MPGVSLAFPLGGVIMYEQKTAFDLGNALGMGLGFSAARCAWQPGKHQGESWPTRHPPGGPGGEAPGGCPPGFTLGRHLSARIAGSGIPTFAHRSPSAPKTAKMCECLLLHSKVIFPTEPPVTAGSGFSCSALFEPGNQTSPRQRPRDPPGESWFSRLFGYLSPSVSPGKSLGKR